METPESFQPQNWRGSLTFRPGTPGFSAACGLLPLAPRPQLRRSLGLEGAAGDGSDGRGGHCHAPGGSGEGPVVSAQRGVAANEGAAGVF